MSLNSEHPGNLPLLPMGWGAANLDFDSAADFWAEVQRVTGGASLGENLDIAMAGESSPRIWLFLHEPGQGALSAAAALAMARELGSRDQAVLILDCDDNHSRLTRWAGRHEAEGWIDMVRYGASVLTSGVALPFAGRRGYILGVGSFTPTEVETREAEDLVNRLKRQADDLVLVAAADATGLLWAPLADIRLLCWDRAQRSADTIEHVIAGFEEADAQLTGLIGFGLPDEGVAFGEAQPARPEETGPSEDEDSFAADDTDDRLEAADLDDIDYSDGDAEDLVDEKLVESEASGEMAPDAATAGETPTAEAEAPARVADPVLRLGPLGEGDADDHGSGSSRVFWGTALVSLALILVVGVYYFKYIRVVDSGLPPGAVVVADLQGSSTGTPLGSETQTGPEQAPATLPEAELAIPEADTATAPAVAALEEAMAASPEESPEESPVDLPAETPQEQPEVQPAGPIFTMDPYLQVVGSDGWALHLYSFPDSLTAGKETRTLQRRGFQTAVRAVEIKDKGRWYRVYVGSFQSRNEAREAQPLLMKELKLDWARPTEF